MTVTPFVCCLTAAADLTTVLWSLDMRCRRRVGGMDLYLSLPIAAIYAVFLGPTELEFRFPRASMLEHETGPRCGNTHSAISPFKGWYTFKTSPPICPPPFRPRTFFVSTRMFFLRDIFSLQVRYFPISEMQCFLNMLCRYHSFSYAAIPRLVRISQVPMTTGPSRLDNILKLLSSTPTFRERVQQKEVPSRS